MILQTRTIKPRSITKWFKRSNASLMGMSWWTSLKVAAFSWCSHSPRKCFTAGVLGSIALCRAFMGGFKLSLQNGPIWVAIRGPFSQMLLGAANICLGCLAWWCSSGFSLCVKLDFLHQLLTPDTELLLFENTSKSALSIQKSLS